MLNPQIKSVIVWNECSECNGSRKIRNPDYIAYQEKFRLGLSEVVAQIPKLDIPCPVCKAQGGKESRVDLKEFYENVFWRIRDQILEEIRLKIEDCKEKE